MIDLSKIPASEVNELKTVLRASAERSDLLAAQSQFTLFSSNIIEKMKIFIMCYRVLNNVYNVIDDSMKTKQQIKTELDLLNESYYRVLQIIDELNKNVRYGSESFTDELFSILKEGKIEDIIDFFSVMLESETILKISKFKGIILEGKSGEMYKDMINKEDKEKQQKEILNDEEEIEEYNDEDEYENPDSEIDYPEI